MTSSLNNRNKYMIDVILDKEITFDLPQGDYAAKLSGIKPFVKQAGKGKQDWVRLLFDVSVPGMQELDCRAGRNFLLSLRQGSDLRNFLTPLLGPDFFKKNSAKSIDLEKTVVGMDGVVTLSHFIGEGYEKPMVMVESFEPAKMEGKD
jgi:hypothetical protein